MAQMAQFQSGKSISFLAASRIFPVIVADYDVADLPELLRSNHLGHLSRQWSVRNQHSVCGRHVSVGPAKLSSRITLENYLL
jgi:hypothetical protein